MSIDLIKKMYKNRFNEEALTVKLLPASGSNRKYYRVFSEKNKAIAAYNADKRENEAFIYMSEFFKQQNLPIPDIYSADLDNNIYLQQDLGHTTLFDYINENKNKIDFAKNRAKIYKSIIDYLILFQKSGKNGFDFSKSYPRFAFDKQSMHWDLNYFKYYFLKLAGVSFDEQLLQDDYHTLIDYLLSVDNSFFMYRDFQSRNIMLNDNQIYFIDYQGGRRGGLYYDLASLLFDAKADLSIELRQEMMLYYYNKVKSWYKIDKEEFTQQFYAFVLIRILQACGAYGYRGLYERKEHFLQSIPYAMQNINWWLKTVSLPAKMPHLLSVLQEMTQSETIKSFGYHTQNLFVKVQSFSYHRGIPYDNSGNGGGFVFDCRALHNPGKYDKYKKLTGMDNEVIDFFENQADVMPYLDNIYQLADFSIETYIKRKFTNLFIAFGCTGGQHRSVYCAEQLVKHIKKKYDVTIELRHREQE